EQQCREKVDLRAAVAPRRISGKENQGVVLAPDAQATRKLQDLARFSFFGKPANGVNVGGGKLARARLDLGGEIQNKTAREASEIGGNSQLKRGEKISGTDAQRAGLRRDQGSLCMSRKGREQRFVFQCTRGQAGELLNGERLEPFLEQGNEFPADARPGAL